VTTVAIMQPYFFPYAGYYRLAVAADVFVIYDCVQFPRRGRVHRCRVTGPAGRPEWLTLPLAKQPRDTLIRDLRFADGAREGLDRRLGRCAWLREPRTEAGRRVSTLLHAPLPGCAEFLEAGLRLTFDLLGLRAHVVRSSDLRIDPSLRGQGRVLAIAGAVGATRYVNSPGGVGLYDPGAFARAGVELEFLTPYDGPHSCMLEALFLEPLEALRRDVVSRTATRSP
jgi:hypothetical protein